MKKTCISRDWQIKSPACSDWQSVDLPNDYSITLPRSADAPGGASNGYFPGGAAVYRKELTLGNEHTILDVDGAYMWSKVGLNGYHLASHPHGYTPFLVDLTQRAKPGEKNELTIYTNAAQTSTRWYSGAGIYRDVFLWTGGEIRIEPRDLFISTPTLESVHAAYEITADRDASVMLKTQVIDAAGECVKNIEQAVSLAKGKNPVSVDFALENANVWDMETPYLYTMRTEITENGAVVETDERKFGVRTVSVNAKDGLLLNGKSVKLRGGCIHHDHGVLGAADFPAACRRKLTLLQKAGFNALRIAHNPPSTTLMEMCDEMGILVMTEAFDCWRLNKGGEYNYHIWFDDWWERDIAAMVRRDRQHPCVISYSTGNEIPESAGHTDGDYWSKALADEIRKHDNTRIVTSATFQMTTTETWADDTAGYFAPLDMAGYNYLYWRYERDHEQFPERVIWGSETHALNFYDSWKTVMENSYVVGDFTWTAYDNLGEAGTGCSKWARDGVVPRIELQPYPWRSCYQGDLDLCGYRRPQSYFRESVWIGNTEPRIFTTHPEHYGEGFTGTGWHWYDVLDSWTFDDAYLGKPVKCEVYTDADEIEWFVNGKNLGRTKPEKAIATIDIPYEKGEISVIAYKNGEECGRSSLHTVGASAAIVVKAETDAISADNRDLCYFDITIVDANGDRVPDAKTELMAIVDGGELLGIFSGDPKNEDQYGSNICHAFEGRALAIVRAKAPGEVRLTVGANGLLSGTDAAKATEV